MIKNPYYKIKEPESNKMYTINSKFGKSILKNYLLMLYGGAYPERKYLTDLESNLASYSSDTDFSFIRPSKINLSKFGFPNLTEKNNKYYFQNNNLLDKTLITNNGYLELHPEYSEFNEVIELFYLADNSKIKKKNLFIKNLIKFNEYPIWNIINIPPLINPIIDPKFNSPLIHKIDSSKYLSGIFGYEYYRISCKDNSQKKILFLWDFHTPFYTPPSQEIIDILELIDHYVRKCELNKNCLDIFIEDAKDINTDILEKIEKHSKSELIGGTTIVGNISDKSVHDIENMEQYTVNLIISILKNFSENTEYLNYITEISNEFEKHNSNFNGQNIFQLVPYLYTYYSKKSLGKDNKINYIKMIELIKNNLNHTVMSDLVKSSSIQDRTILRMILKGRYSWRRATGVRVHQFDISQQNYGHKTTRSFYLNNYEDLNKLVIGIMRSLIVYSLEDLNTYLTRIENIDISDTNGKVYNLKNNINDKKSLYLYCISCVDNDSQDYSYTRGRIIAEKLLENRKNLMKEISNKYTPESQQFLKSYESYVVNDLLFQYLNFKTQNQIDNIDEFFFTKKQLVSYMLKLIEIYPEDKFFLGSGGVRLFITETYAIARMFRIFDSKKNRIENCDTSSNSLKNIIYFAGGFHTEITSKFIKTILKIEPISSNNVFNNPVYKYLQDDIKLYSLPRYLDLDGTNFFFKNSKSIIEKRETM